MKHVKNIKVTIFKSLSENIRGKLNLTLYTCWHLVQGVFIVPHCSSFLYITKSFFTEIWAYPHFCTCVVDSGLDSRFNSSVLVLSILLHLSIVPSTAVFWHYSMYIFSEACWQRLDGYWQPSICQYFQGPCMLLLIVS